MHKVLNILSSVLPLSVIGLVESTLRDLIHQGTGAGLFGLFLLLISATNAYLSLQRGAERPWSSARPRRRAPSWFLCAGTFAIFLLLAWKPSLW